MKKHIPNILTLTNLFMGCASVTCLFVGDWKKAMLFTLVSAIADFLDGLVARKLNISGDLGKQLDSLADVISFGFVPGLIAYILLSRAFGLPTEPISHFTWWAMPGFIVTVFSGLRLGIFNIDTRQTTGFIGLNTPMDTIFFIGVLWLYNTNETIREFLSSPVVLYILVICMSLLMVSPLRTFSFKVKSYKLKDNIYRLLFLIGIAIIIILFHEASLCVGVLWYLTLSFIEQMVGGNKLENKKA